MSCGCNNNRPTGYSGATIAVATLSASTNEVAIPLSGLDGWISFINRDAWVTLFRRDSRVGGGSEVITSYRLGPASRLDLPVDPGVGGSRFSYVTKAIASGVSYSATNGLQATATAVPQLTVYWSGGLQPPDATRSGISASAETLADTSAVAVGTPLIAAPPAYARACHVVASSSVTVQIVDGASGVVVGELPAARDAILRPLDPWAVVKVTVAAGSANVWLSWGDR